MFCTFVYRMTLLLGPPSSGKTTLLKALASKLESSLKVASLVDNGCIHGMESVLFVCLRADEWRCNL